MRIYAIFLMALIGTFMIDQGIKELFVAGYDWQGKCFSLELHYNKGVAFSMFAFLGPYLKWIQVLLVGGIILYLVISKMIIQHPLAFGILVGAALGNLYDRFIHLGVVDYFAWHCWFDFAVFNYADVMIDLSIGWVLLKSFMDWRREQKG